jgi:hypothetical protein
MSSSKAKANLLPPAHFQTFNDTVISVLNTSQASDTYAQIIDGAPRIGAPHPYGSGGYLIAARESYHTDTSAESVRVWEHFRAEFSVGNWAFKTTVRGTNNKEAYNMF